MNMFNSQQEIWEYLISGGLVKENEYNEVYELSEGKLVFSSEGKLIFFKKISTENFLDYENFSKVTRPEPKKKLMETLQ